MHGDEFYGLIDAIAVVMGAASTLHQHWHQLSDDRREELVGMIAARSVDVLSLLRSLLAPYDGFSTMLPQLESTLNRFQNQDRWWGPHSRKRLRSPLFST